MRKHDVICAVAVLAIFVPFFIIEPLKELFFSMTASHGLIMGFLKFAVLATLGEMIGLRISNGCYNYDGFGLFPRFVIWGILGVAITAAMVVFSSGVPVFLEYCGLEGAASSYRSADLTWLKLLTAFAISVSMNSIFAPVFMTLHKITDTHIISCGGSVKALVTPIDFGKIMSELNWKVQWSFVFRKTIPFFWYPAHTVTFILPEAYRVLFAALLGVALGIILAVAARKSDRK